MPNGDEITYVLMSEIDVNGVVLKVKDAEAQSAIALNNIAISTRINDLNTRLEAIENPSYSYANVQVDWNELDTTSYSYIKNKPDLSVYLTQETQPDWEEDDTTNASYIQNKPTIPTVSNTITENDTNAVSGGAVYSKFADLIGSAPAALDTLQEIAYALNNDADLAGTLTTQINTKIPKVSNPAADNFASFNSDGTVKDSGVSASSFITNETQPDWEEDDTTSAAYIQNKPDLTNFLTQETQSDWNITATTSAAYIKNKPEIPAIIYWQFTEEVENEISTWNTNGHTVSELSQILLNDDILLLILMKDVDGVNAIYKHAGWLFFLPFTSGLGGEPITKAYMFSEGENDQINIEKVNVSNPISFSSQFEGDPSGRFAKICGDYIDNDNNFERYTSQILVDGEGIKLTTHQFATATYNGYEIATKNDIPTVPTVSATVIQNDANPVSGGAVYGKFEDLIGGAPAALDTLQEIASALNNDTDLAGTLTTQISNKVPKVSSPTQNNFASFNSDGTIKDSGVSASSFITSIKTVNNESLVGTGNIVVSGLPQVSSADNGKILMVVNGQWQLVSPSVLYSGQGLPNNAQGNNGDLYMQTD